MPIPRRTNRRVDYPAAKLPGLHFASVTDVNALRSASSAICGEGEQFVIRDAAVRRQVGAQLDQVHERPPRGGWKWRPSSVGALWDEASRVGFH
ncbi:hypothetical protein [Sinorhizobium psoraleae]|uniref:hypothetical protein n=1 Tax=Sinorhizobium psoraleae TaxID=520838 RepID=UPI001FE34DD3|nr:hypothetical protein [Sinorhizobium psoraleae]